MLLFGILVFKNSIASFNGSFRILLFGIVNQEFIKSSFSISLFRKRKIPTAAIISFLSNNLLTPSVIYGIP